MSNNEIQVLFALPPVKIDDIEGVDSVQDLLKLLAHNQDTEALRREIKALKGILMSFGKNLEWILDNVDDPYDRAQSLRHLVSSMKVQDGQGVS